MSLNAFREETYTDGYDEIIVHFDINNRPTCAYAHKDSAIVRFQNSKMCKWRFAPNKSNPLFYELVSKDVFNFIKWLKNHYLDANQRV